MSAEPACSGWCYALLLNRKGVQLRRRATFRLSSSLSESLPNPVRLSGSESLMFLNGRVGITIDVTQRGPLRWRSCTDPSNCRSASKVGKSLELSVVQTTPPMKGA
jgi:hypothetical protein